MFAGTYIISGVLLIITGMLFRNGAVGVEAAQRDLEDIAPPLSAPAAELDEGGEEEDPYTLGRGQHRGAGHAPSWGSTWATHRFPPPRRRTLMK